MISINRSSITLMALVAAIAVAIVVLPYDNVGGPIIVTLVIVTASVFLIPALAHPSDRGFLIGIAAFGLLFRIITSVLRLSITETVWGLQDAARYASRGGRFSELLRAGQWDESFRSFDTGLSLGTDAMSYTTGVVFAVFGETVAGAFIFFGFLAFIGCLAIIRAVYIAFPQNRHGLFASLMMFYPPLVFWTSSLGKDSVQMFFVGLAVLALALFSKGRNLIGALLLAAFSIAGLYVLRAEVALVFVLAATLAMFITTSFRFNRNMALRLFILLAVPAILIFQFQRVESALGLEISSIDAIVGRWEEQRENVTVVDPTSGSYFDAPDIRSPDWVPSAIIVVMFRPFPWEAKTLLALLQSLDGIAVGLLIVWSAWRIPRTLRSARSSQLVAFSLLFLLGMTLGLSALGNFGLLARQKAVIYPFVFILLTATLQWREFARIPVLRRAALAQP